MRNLLTLSLLAAIVVVFAAFQIPTTKVSETVDNPVANSITMSEVAAAQQAWGEGIVAIGAAFTDNGDYRGLAGDHVRTFYNYTEGATVLFKPTLASEDQFRGVSGPAGRATDACDRRKGGGVRRGPEA